VIVTLPYPDKVLSPNARAHWATIARAKKKAREAASWAIISAAGSKANLALYAEQDRIPMVLAFYPVDNRRRDIDNALASAKAALDGIADALGADDSRFVLTMMIHKADGRARLEVAL
jgi:crossover junction endodeoxyribonuclease RusA